MTKDDPVPLPDLADLLGGPRPLLGVLSPSCGDLVAETAATAGVDVVVLDATRRPLRDVRAEVLVAAAHGLPTLVRVPRDASLGEVVASGAAGVVVTGVGGGDDVKELVAEVRRTAGGPGGRAPARSFALVVEPTGAGDVGEVATAPGVSAVAVPDTVSADTATGRATMATCGSAALARRRLAAGHGLVVLDLAALLGGVLADLTRPHGVGAGGMSLDGRTPLVLLPGMLGGAATWDAVVHRLLDVADPVVLRIDLDDSIGEMAASVLAQAPPSFAIAGHSLGGIVALEVQRRAPDRVTRLALCNTSARDGAPEQQAAWSGLRERVAREPFDRLAAELATSHLPEGRRHDRPLVDAGAAMARDVGADGLLRQLAAQSTRPDSRPDLPSIRVPTMVLTGAEDQVCPAGLQEELVADIAGAVHEVVQGAGHMAPMEDPTATAEALRRWLRPGPTLEG